jgi:flavoprotein hydroxylase
MCGGMRDLANLVWKLELVLDGRAPDDLLDTYGSERSTNIQHFIHLSMALGQVICVLDENAATERDRRMIAGGADPAKVLPDGPPPRLGPGILADHPAAGLPMVQGRVARAGAAALLDTVVEPGLLLLGTNAHAVGDLDAADRAALATLGGHVEHLGTGGLHDVDGVYRDWFDEHGAIAVLLRPDNYIYGAASTASEARALVASLSRAVTSGAVRA